jgi:hypothetical protein
MNHLMSKHTSVLPFAVLLVLGSTQSWAVPVTSAASYAYGNSNISPPSPLTDSDSQTSNSGVPLTLTSSVIDSKIVDSANSSRTIQAESSVHVQAGMIQLYASSVASAHDYGPNSYVSANANTSATGSWSDTFTIDGGSLNGTVGHLVAGFRVDGSLASSFDSSANWQASLDEQFRAQLRLTSSATGQDVFLKGGKRHLVNANGDQLLAVSGFTDFSSPGVYTISLDFKFGSPIQMYMWGDAYAYTSAFANNSGTAGYIYPDSNISAVADFGHTINWGGFLGLTDAQGNAVSSYTVTSLSGLDYGVASVPEPETYAMIMTGLGFVVFATRRRKQNA